MSCPRLPVGLNCVQLNSPAGIWEPEGVVRSSSCSTLKMGDRGDFRRRIISSPFQLRGAEREGQAIWAGRMYRDGRNGSTRAEGSGKKQWNADSAEKSADKDDQTGEM